MINRRNFLKTSIAGTAFISLPITIKAMFNRVTDRLVILHTNDVHSHLDPFPLDHERFPGMGGFANRAALVNKIRETNEHVLLFDSGDIFQGTPYFNFYEGRLELQLMSKIGYDAATLGNHEFDNGLESLANQVQHASFPFVSSNYQLDNTPLDGKVLPWIIFKRGNIKVGVVGLGINPEGLVSPVNFRGLTYLDPVTAGEETAKMLKHTKGCDIVVALSHLGFQMSQGRVDDLTVAASTKNIDIILGGHSHRFMEVPELISNAAGKPVIVLQSGFGGVRMSRLDIVAERGETFVSTRQYVLNN